MATAQVMKDTELRGLILQAFYYRRQAQSHQLLAGLMERQAPTSSIEFASNSVTTASSNGIHS